MRLTEVEAGSQIYQFADDRGHRGLCAIWAREREDGTGQIVFGARGASGTQPALVLDALVPLASSLLLDRPRELQVFVVSLGVPDLHPLWRFPYLANGDDTGFPVDPEVARRDFAGFVPEVVLSSWDWEPLKNIVIIAS